MQTLRLRCVECGHPDLVINSTESIKCTSCGHTFQTHPQGNTPILVGKNARLTIDEILEMRTAPQKIDLKVAQGHWDTGNLYELLDSCEGKLLLNFGSGDGGDRKWLENRGYDVTSFDIYPGEYTDYICDGHELPFADEQFEIVTSTAVFEHLYNPFKAAEEICRVLKPGGAHVGSCSFLEPFHSDSYFHMTHLGITEIFKQAGFSKVDVYPGWSYLESLNKYFWLWNEIKPIRILSRFCNKLKFEFGKAMWKIGYKAKGRELPMRITHGFCGSLIFKAIK